MDPPKPQNVTDYLPSRELQIFVLRCYLDEAFSGLKLTLTGTELEHVNNDRTSSHGDLDDTFDKISEILASSTSPPSH